MQTLVMRQVSRGELSRELRRNLIHCSYVTRLHLDHNNLKGPLPDSIGKMIKMQVMDMSHNDISGDLPASFYNLNALQNLDLGFNAFAGLLPNFTALHSLRQLHLNDNNPGFHGDLPDYIFDAGMAGSTYRNTSTVTELDLSGNNLTGSLPIEVYRMTELTHLDLSGNRLSGYLPPLPKSLDADDAVLDFSGENQQFWCPFPAESAHHAAFKLINCTCMTGHRCPTHNDPVSDTSGDTQCEYDCAACGAGSFSNVTFSSECTACALGTEAPFR